ncbi:hypothetical protein J3459_017799 [Metarhizium acridum]|nr:hypothetical protein J3459_017799 [Metarhizium acridum]
MTNKTAISFDSVKDKVSKIRKKFVPLQYHTAFYTPEKSFSAIAAPVSSYLPDFSTGNDPEIGKRATPEDLLSHSTGLAPVDHAATGFYDEYYNKGEDQVKIASHLPVAYSFRSRWLYNNTIYGVIGELIVKITGKSAGQAMKQKIFDPLGMKRTCTSAKEYTDDNVATGYSVLDQGPALPLEDPQLEDGGIQGAAGFVRSSVNDMLTWARAVIAAEDEAERRGKSSRLPGIEFARCARRPITLENGLGENSYGFAWFRHTLPLDSYPRSSQTLHFYPTPPLSERPLVRCWQ